MSEQTRRDCESIIAKIVRVALTDSDEDRAADANRIIMMLALITTDQASPEYPKGIVRVIEKAVMMVARECHVSESRQ